MQCSVPFRHLHFMGSWPSGLTHWTVIQWKQFAWVPSLAETEWGTFSLCPRQCPCTLISACLTFPCTARKKIAVHVKGPLSPFPHEKVWQLVVYKHTDICRNKVAHVISITTIMAAHKGGRKKHYVEVHWMEYWYTVSCTYSSMCHVKNCIYYRCTCTKRHATSPLSKWTTVLPTTQA